MKKIRIDKVFRVDSNEEVDFKKGLLLIDDKAIQSNWTVSLSDVKDPGSFQAEDSSYHLRLTDRMGHTYVGTAGTDLISNDGSVLMVSKGDLTEEA
ncbi:hypothetical protein [Halobacillus massiliensis]|uniref:hypothetical protein n=1 Tax=Halobacillus massiliensis TaxID=1926286 RepID=UPI0009E1F53A|nr:hypothetical protein [Halobacillus massiliensis]